MFVPLVSKRKQSPHFKDATPCPNPIVAVICFSTPPSLIVRSATGASHLLMSALFMSAGMFGTFCNPSPKVFHWSIETQFAASLDTMSEYLSW
jgi:hypothetical protein